MAPNLTATSLQKFFGFSPGGTPQEIFSTLAFSLIVSAVTMS